ncbi:bet3 family protein [Rhodotorula toruloides]|uniref:Trafficking protein particle complex subunit BET3 n=1 Tax=Rhodotorula toruloides TaxID=5286 RepID=A0A511KFH4_RHOTO|nr:bet3 family protein [Rhodotorula toruloides]
MNFPSSTSTANRYKTMGDDLYKRSEKINAELFALTYGAGYNIGVRLIEDFLARTGLARCRDFSEVGETMAKVAFRSFLSITPTLIHHPAQPPTQPQPAFSLIFDENPLTDFVELPEEAVEGGLVYAKILEGVIRGAMEMVQTSVEAKIVSDALCGDEKTELRVTLIRYLEEEMPPGDE